MVKVSVIIVNFNGKKFIKECVDSVLASKFGSFEVVVVDNASVDGSYEYLKKSYGNKQVCSFRNKIRIIRSEEQLYFTGGSNLGARYARGEKLIFLNSDCVVTKNWILEMVKFAGENKKWLVQPLLRKSYGGQAKIIDNAGTDYNFFGFAMGRGYNKADRGQYDRNEEVQVCAGTCFMIGRDFFWSLGGFDERFRYQYEDVDLNLRAKKAGGKSFLCYKSVIYHKGSATFKENVSGEELLYNIRKNRLMTAMKNFFGIEKIIRIGLVLVVNAESALASKVRLGLARTFERTLSFGGLTKRRYEIALKYCLDKDVLDVGCGLGQGTYYLAKNGAKSALGIDNSKGAIEYANNNFQRENLKFLLCDALLLSLGSFDYAQDKSARDQQGKRRGNLFDVVVAFELIEHLPSGCYEKFVGDVKKILNKNGVFILSTPNKLVTSPDSLRPLNPYHAREFLPEEILDLCKKYFLTFKIFGSEIINKDFNRVRKSVDSSFFHSAAVLLKRSRLVCEILAFVPAFLKRKITGEYRLPKLMPDDFRYTKKEVEKRENLLLICS